MKFAFNPAFFHCPGDGLAAAMDDHGIDPGGFEKDNVPGDAGADGLIRRIHEATAIFDDKRLSVEFLYVGQRFQERRGFGDQVLHGFIVREKNWAGLEMKARFIARLVDTTNVQLRFKGG